MRLPFSVTLPGVGELLATGGLEETSPTNELVAGLSLRLIGTAGFEPATP